MKRMLDGDWNWSTWFRALDELEQEWFNELFQKVERADEESRWFRAEMNRLRQRGYRRHNRRLRLGTA